MFLRNYHESKHQSIPNRAILNTIFPNIFLHTNGEDACVPSREPREVFLNHFPGGLKIPASVVAPEMQSRVESLHTKDAFKNDARRLDAESTNRVAGTRKKRAQGVKKENADISTPSRRLRYVVWCVCVCVRVNVVCSILEIQ